MNKLRSSAITQGVQRSPNRSMLRAVGFNDEDFNKHLFDLAISGITPIIAHPERNSIIQRDINILVELIHSQ